MSSHSIADDPSASTSGAIASLARQARSASILLGDAPLSVRNGALLAVAEAYERRRADIQAENRKDLEEAERLCAEGKLARPLIKRLDLQGSKFDAIPQGLRAVAALPDPIGVIQRATEMDAGLNLTRVSCPIGVICAIFESRPDALPQIASLCLKSGNALLLKGGSEAKRSNQILARVFAEAAAAGGAPAGWLHLLETREDVNALLGLDQYIDLIIPRGGNELVRHIMSHTKIPVTGHQDGICHVYIHRAADPEMAVRIAVDSKCQYPAVCNAAEKILVDEEYPAAEFERLAQALIAKGVKIRGDERTRARLKDMEIEPATQEDWRAEYLDLIVAMRIVSGVDEAIEHINAHSSHHTDAIVTGDAAAAERFLRRVDSSSVMHNASTRFADGYRYGLGAEVGISTNKIHSRGPVGLEGLTIYKYILRGSGQTVSEYAGPNAKPYTHRVLV
ncbi:MAG: glutamate-5-semialdehyde dehydrogenase [Candidatus Sumerlaeota bacterium]|nr:glutamate-5-semialdehyde dehydrogenase [Candidatus Sumerlaeota bacterium]